MNTLLFTGLLTGLAFGFLLQKGRVLRFDRQVGAMLLKDMTIVKFMLSAILVGMTGILLLSQLGVIELHHKALNLGALLIGGGLFGIGWSAAGYCPGTAVGALGEGRFHAIFPLLGMLTGAAVYAELYPAMKTTILAWKDFGPLGLPEMTGHWQWLIVAVFWAFAIILFNWFEKKKL